jgi:enamine deaminase RidA (YjgF/YER057c/UK114 family)
VTTLEHHPETGTGLSSECTVARDLVFTTQIPLDDDGVMPTGIEAQCDLVLRNTRSALEAVGSSMSKIAQLTIYLTDIADRPAFNSAYESHVPKPYPVRAAVGVAALARPEMRVEVTAIAVR